jgi:hypothetical protein
MDHTEPPVAVIGIFASILVMRDLSSGMQLMTLPVQEETLVTTIAALQVLFLEHRAPLAIKSDIEFGCLPGIDRGRFTRVKPTSGYL